MLQRRRVLDFDDVDITQVNSYINIGSVSASLDEDGLRARGITHIINCTRTFPNVFAKCKAITYQRVPLHDNPNQIIDFAAAFALIDAARLCGGSALVHCNKGMSRSAAVVIGYLIQHTHVSCLQALKVLQSKRRLVSPNAGFLRRLLELELRVRGAVSIDIAKYELDRFASADSLGFDAPASLNQTQQQHCGSTLSISPITCSYSSMTAHHHKSSFDSVGTCATVTSTPRSSIDSDTPITSPWQTWNGNFECDGEGVLPFRRSSAYSSSSASSSCQQQPQQEWDAESCMPPPSTRCRGSRSSSRRSFFAEDGDDEENFDTTPLTLASPTHSSSAAAAAGTRS